MIHRPQSTHEELANSACHGIALVAAVAGCLFLFGSIRHEGFLNVIGIGVFAFTMILLYLTSTLYHALPQGKSKNLLLKLDHSAIYLFIAGSYTPFALSTLDNNKNWGLFGLIWAIALIGATLKAFNKLANTWLSTGIYLLMGWIVLIAAMPFVEKLPISVVTLLLSGGLAYTVGILFYLLDSRIRYSHAVWHGFVVAGSSCHFFAVLNFIN